MATINFLYRSKKNQSKLLLRIRYEINGQQKEISSRIKFEVSHSDWKTYLKNQYKKSIKDKDLKKLVNDTDEEVLKYKNHFENLIKAQGVEYISKDWLKEEIDRLDYPQKYVEQAIKIPKKLIPFIDYYIDVKSNDLTNNRIQKLNVIKAKLERFESATNHKYAIIEINDFFKKQYVDYCENEHYSTNTISGDIAIIKTVCRYAKKCDIETHKQLEDLSVKETKAKNVYLSFQELEQIQNLDLSNNERLDNVRDWLIISCFTGQRISDFMRFDASMIEGAKGEEVLTFTQQKTNTLTSITFLKEAKEIVDKNNGNFPRPLSHQKYNDYLKELCKLAGIDEPTQGTIRQAITNNVSKSRNDYRNVTGVFPKWRLITSHVGRRSFATNFYYSVPTSVLIGITGHSTEAMFLKYIQKPPRQKAVLGHSHFK